MGPVTKLECMLALCAFAVVACGAEEPACKVRTVSAALTNSTPRPEYLKLEPWQDEGVVQVWTGDTFQCSGVWVSDRAVLTAKHCAPDEVLEALDADVGDEDAGLGDVDGALEDIVVAFGPTHDSRLFESTARVVAAHAELDVLVLELAQSPAEGLEVAPLPIARALPARLREGSLVQLAGFGSDDGTAGSRGFLVETVTDIDRKQISVTARGFGGACFGDSGGPLLVRDDDGQPRTLGLLASGSASCLGTDSYTRVDKLIEWLERAAPIALEPPDDSWFDRPYEALGHEGRCFDGRAMWLEEGRVRAALCEDDRACGWSAKVQGYRCVASDAEACDGLDDLGTCRDGIATWCEQGKAAQNPCSVCGFACVRSPKTGKPVCVKGPDA